MENVDYVDYGNEEEVTERIDEDEKEHLPYVEAYAENNGDEDMFDDREALYGYETENYIKDLLSNNFLRGVRCIHLHELDLKSCEEFVYYLILLPEIKGYNEHWIGLCRLKPAEYFIFDSYGQAFVDILHERNGINSYKFADDVKSSLLNGLPAFITLTPRYQNANTNLCGKYQVLFAHLFDHVKGNPNTFQDRLEAVFTPVNEWSSTYTSINNDEVCKSLFEALIQHLN